MKLIFSRKGFDSSAGGIASPILPDGRLLPLPIPQSDGPVKFSQLRFDGQSLSSMIKQLGGKCWRERCHLDPDLDASLIERPEGWLPAFGQSGSAQRHLEQEGVGVGDLFLFFGWFRQTEWHKGKLRFVSDAPDLHLFHGWLQIDRLLRPGSDNIESGWLDEHPHMRAEYQHNCIYLARNHLEFSGFEGVSGGGAFDSLSQSRVLTRPGELRTQWQLPEFFWPQQFDKALSYHRKEWRWQRGPDNEVWLDSAFRGQEFVFDCGQVSDTEICAWLQALFAVKE